MRTGRGELGRVPYSDVPLGIFAILSSLSLSMSALATPPLALYVHFPWCVRKCPYCDFNSYTLSGALAQEPYVARLARDITAQAPQVAGRPVTSVFFGGGTPSLFSPEAIGRVLEAARRHLLVAPDAEVTLEANPGAIERGAFREYRAAGVTRVSLGALRSAIIRPDHVCPESLSQWLRRIR